MTSMHSRTLRRLTIGVSTICLAIMFGLQIAGPRVTAQASNPIPAENQLPGNPRSEWDVTGSGDATIQGFATDISVNKGGTVSFKVTTTAASFAINIYRLGYYQGNGARKVATISGITGKNQAACLTDTATGLYDCGNWTESSSWTVPATSVSGIYIARLARSDNGGASHIPFVVRDDAAQADIVLQTSDTTWQAYNQYGGHSLYQGSPIRGYKVSYNRPFATRGQSTGYGTSNYLFYAEYPMTRWLEANGFNVKYQAGIDTDRYGSSLTGAAKPKVFMTVGHDEYWSAGQRNAVEAARAAGVHLGFVSGNENFWKTRWETSIDGSATPYRTLVAYKETHANAKLDPADPPTWTGTWRDPRFSPPADGGRPENALTGQLFTVNRGTAPINVPGTYANLRFWRNTAIAALAPNQSLSLAIDTLGYEWDEDLDNGFRPAGSIQMSSTVVSAPEQVQDFGSTYLPGTATHHLSLYRHSSGALVFGAGTVQWVWGLDTNHDVDPDFGSSTPDPNMRQAMINLLADMGTQPATIQSALIVASASTDTTAPSSTIVSPASGASIPAGTVVTVSGTATDAGGVVGGVEVAVDGGTTWRRATGTASWSYAWVPGALGSASLRSRATDDSGNLEPAIASVPLTITQANCPCSIWTPSLTVPWRIDSNDTAAVEVGLKFQTDVGGIVNGLRFYKALTNTGTHTGHLWSSGGVLLASVTFAGESASGWQQANFSSQVIIQPATTYVISYFAPVGHYSDDQYYLGRSGVDQWPLHALKSGVDGPNGVFFYGASGFPNQTWFADSYGVDVVFTPDLTSPTVALTSPAAGASITGNAVTVSATASDNLGIAGVQFKIDGAALSAEDTASPYSISWNSTLTANGTHTLTAVARDSAGNLTTSAPVTVSVSNTDTVPPTVSISSPLNTATVRGAVSVQAAASDNQAVVGVQFLVDGASYGAEVTTAPYAIAWDTTALANNSTHTLSARARDTSNNLTTSASNAVTVSNPVAGAPAMDALVWTDQPINQTTTVSPAFSTIAGNELLLAFISADYLGGANTTVTGVSGAGAAWALVGRTNVQSGTAEIWRAFAPSPLSNAVVTATLSQGADSMMTVVTFSNVDTSGTNGSGAIGATATANSLGGAPSATLTTTRNNSWVFGVGTDYDTATARTVGANQVLVHTYFPPVGDTYWVQRVLTPTPLSGTSVTINDTAPSGDRYNLFIAEIKPANAPDTTPPAVSLTAPADAATVSGNAVTVSATASDNVGVTSVQFKLDGVNLGAADTASPYSMVWNTTTAANGSHSLTAVASDAAGNTTTATTVTVTVNNDTTPPTVSMTAPADAATVSGTTVTVSATAADAVAVTGVQFKLDGANLGAEVTTAPYSVVWDTTPIVNGSHALTAVARDAAGNTATATAVTVTVNNVDSTAPIVSMTAPAASATVSGTNVTVAATATDNVAVVGVQFRLDGVNLGAEDTASPYTVAWNTSGVANGAHTVSAVARDAAGNTATAAVTVTVDNDITAPTVSMTAPAAGATVSGTNVTVAATATDNVAVVGVQFRLDGVNLGAEDTASPYTVAWNTSGVANGAHTVSAVARDAAGNTATAAVTVTVDNDITAPTVSMTAPADASTVSGVNVTVSASASDNVAVAGVQFKLDGVNLGAEVTASPYSISWNTTTATNASHALTAIARDAAGNTATATAMTVTVSNSDSTPPTVSMTAPANGATVAGSGVTVTAAASDNIAVLGVQFKLDGANLGAEVTTSPYAISWNTTTAVNGSHSLSAVARDGAGNTATATAVTVTVGNDTTPPAVSMTAPANGATVSGVNVTVSASASDNVAVAGVQFKLDGVNLGAEVTASPYSVSWNTTTAASGSHSLTAVARDSAGNAATAVAITVTVNNTDTTPPTVASTTPLSGATSVGAATTVTATFSEAMDPTTLTTSTFVLKDPTNVVVTATVSYNSTTRVATLTPSLPLSASKTYTATVNGGSAGAKDVAGNALATSSVWSFTTASSVSIWSAAATPSAIATNDASAVELGVKFRADVAGIITGVRFYKGSTNTGTHTGTLWSSTGTKLATATFSGETASGWQQVTFSKGIAVTANTTYVVSYHTNVGNYAYDAAYFASSGADNAPLHALANSVSANGVFRYGVSAFPNSTFNANNYWVDLVFVPK